MRELVVHIGTHKTGSTAIQRLMLENRSRLLDRGVHYPDIGFHYYGHHKLQSALEHGSPEELAAIATALDALDGTVVLSSENFSRSKHNAIASLAGMIKSDRVRIVYYQRNLLDMVYVWWQELVKHGSDKTMLAYYAESLSRPAVQHILNPKAIMDLWSGAFGPEAMEIYLYDAIEDVAEHFIETVLGLHDFPVPGNNRGINKSFDVPSTEFIRTLNFLGLRGISSLINNEDAQALRNKLVAASAGKLGFLNIDFNCSVFRRIETEFKKTWGHRIIGFDPAQPLFSKRESALGYIDSSFWLTEPTLATEITAYAARVRAAEPQTDG